MAFGACIRDTLIDVVASSRKTAAMESITTNLVFCSSNSVGSRLCCMLHVSQSINTQATTSSVVESVPVNPVDRLLRRPAQ